MRSHDLNGTIIYNGKSSADLGVIVNKLPVIRKPKRKGSTTAIPGRSGALAREEGGYENYVQPYEISITDTNRGISAISGDVAAWLLNTRGYIRLEDSFDPDVYRMARFAGPFDIEPLTEDDGKAVIEFDCQPQRYLKSGEKEIVLSSGEGTIFNPTAFEARPLLKITAQPREAVVIPYDVTLSWTEGQAISGEIYGSAAFTPNPYLNNYDFYRNDRDWENFLSQPIDVEGCTAAIITTAQRHYTHGTYTTTDPNARKGYSQFLCYTFLDSDGIPVGTNQHNYATVLDHAEIPIPSDAKTLYIAAEQNGSGSWYIEPSVTLYPPPAIPYSDSTVTINGTTIHLSTGSQATVFLDCDLHDAYFPNMENANNVVSFEEVGNHFPTFPGLSPGENAIVVASETTISATIVPRWWTL